MTRLATVGAVLAALGFILCPAGSTHPSPILGTAASGWAQASVVPRINATYSPEFSESCNPYRASVHFFANATGGVPPYNFSWNFEDGSPVVFLQDPVHSFASPGVYNPVLTVTDSKGYSNGTFLSLYLPAPPCAAPETGTSPWVLDGVVGGFLVAACGLIALTSRRWRE